MPQLLTPAVYLRAGLAEEEEAVESARRFPTFTSRVEVPPGSLAFCRYSALPYNGELCRDLELLGSRCANSEREHAYAANFDYYQDFKDATFPSWDRLQDVPSWARSGPLVVKGRANSRKQEWLKKMFAPNFLAASLIASELMCDPLIGPQGVIARQYVPLESFETALSGMPLANEWRCFYLGGERVCHGYYWGQIDDWSKVDAARPDFETHGLPFADELGRRASSGITFCAIDVAKTQDGRWMMVELNDGNMSGLNGSISAADLYGGIESVLARRPDLLHAGSLPKPARRGARP